MKKYYLAMDAGGSKVHLLLFDDALNRIDFDVAASSNPNVNPIPEIINSMHKTFERMFERNPQIKHLSGVYACTLCSIDILLSPLAELSITYENVKVLSEGEMGMYSNCISGNAVIALSGTGSDIYCVENNQTAPGTIGGWGAIVADEGSGYWIGREAMIAAIHDYELRGEKTVITQMLMERLYPNDFSKSIFSVYESSSPVRSVAAMSRMVDSAARHGDQVAIDILCRAAHLLAQQVKTMYLRRPESFDYPLMVTGGSWKNYLLFSHFREEIKKLYSEKKVYEPVFEPIVGSVFYYGKCTGMSDEQVREILMQNFAVDRYILPDK